MLNQRNVQSKGFSGSLLRASSHFRTQLVNVALIATIALLLIASPTVKAQAQLPPAPADSSTGVTQATSADGGMQCASGYALSGGSCVLLSSMASPPSCPAGQILSGDTCVPPSNFFPVVHTCPAGQILSGGACVPVIDCPTGLVLSNNVCIPWGTGGLSFCPPQPVQTQYLGCPPSQIGSITQHNVGTTCDPATHVWAMSGWTTSDNTCTAPPGCPVPTVVNWSQYGNTCTGTVHYLSDLTTVPVPSGTVVTVPNDDTGFDGAAQATCNNGTYTTVGTCTPAVVAPPPPPPPARCGDSAWATKPCGHFGPTNCPSYGPEYSSWAWWPSYNCMTNADAIQIRVNWCLANGQPSDC